uniref:Uncharacterized protein n=1 Tax=Rhabditophanes sp. KR3021 TaxID=114890 RepID=A0AC35TVK8_9BILA
MKIYIFLAVIIICTAALDPKNPIYRSLTYEELNFDDFDSPNSFGKYLASVAKVKGCENLANIYKKECSEFEATEAFSSFSFSTFRNEVFSELKEKEPDGRCILPGAHKFLIIGETN